MPPLSLETTGASQVAELEGALSDGGHSAATVEATARHWLGAGLHRADETMWGLLFAHWAVADGPGLIAFVEKTAPPADREWLRGLAWASWGAADPEASFAAGKNLPPSVMRRLLSGIADTDAAKAAECAWRSPDAQFMMSAIASQVAAQAPEKIDALLERAVYDGARIPLQEAQIAALARSDPEKALAAAQQMGIFSRNPVAEAITAIAAHDLEKALAMMEEMPSSRSKALSVVSLAGTWAARDPEAALAWVRETQYGPVRHAALVQIAATRGSVEPAAGLQLIEEAGWESGGDFSKMHTLNMPPSEKRPASAAVAAAASLLQQLSLLDPEAARGFLNEKVPETFRDEVSTLSGLTP